MSEQKQPVSETPAKETNINKGRRRLSRAALATPVIASLASRPALAGNCLSNMMSGNLSDPDRGQCSKGWSPGGWKNEGGYPNATTWAEAGFNFFTSTISNVPVALNRNSVPPTTLLRIVLDNSEWPRIGGGSTGPKVDWDFTKKLVCAYLNAALSDTSSSFQYILTRQQVVDLAGGLLPVPPGFTSLQTFLESTWTGPSD